MATSKKTAKKSSTGTATSGKSSAGGTAARNPLAGGTAAGTASTGPTTTEKAPVETSPENAATLQGLAATGSAADTSAADPSANSPSTHDTPAASADVTDPGPLDRFSAFTVDIYGALRSYTPHQLNLLHELSGAMLVDAYAHVTDRPDHPYQRRVTFGCGHEYTLLIPMLGPLHLQKALEPYRSGPCPSCLSTELTRLSESRVYWAVPALYVDSPGVLAQAERRRYKQVWDFVSYLAASPRDVLEAFRALSPELEAVLNADDGGAWLTGKPLLAKLFDLCLSLDAPEEESANRAKRNHDRQQQGERAEAVLTITDYLTKRRSASV
ncbi:hypothetical protein BH24DEI2_BH24DEI2_26310 [soil metagenome]